MRFGSHQFPTMGHFLCQGEKVIPCSLLNLQRKAIQMWLAYLSLLPLSYSLPNFASKWNSFLAEGREEGLGNPHAASFKLQGRADGSTQCFLYMQILFLKAKCKLWLPRLLFVSLWGLSSLPRLGQCMAGRDLAFVGFWVKKCSGIQDGRGVTSL